MLEHFITVIDYPELIRRQSRECCVILPLSKVGNLKKSFRKKDVKVMSKRYDITKK